MERAGQLFGKLKFAQQEKGPETRARAAWKKAAGARVAAHTRVAALVRGTLVVEVEDIVWQQNLAKLGHFIVSNLARELGEVVVTGLDFRRMTPRFAPQRAESARPPARASDDADAIADPVMQGLYREARKKA